MTKPGFSPSITPFKILVTDSGSIACPSGVSMRMPRSAPIDSAVRIVSWDLVGPMETATISVTVPFSLSRTTSSTAISSKGFIDILTLASSTPDPSDLTRILTLKSTTRFTATRTFIPREASPRGLHVRHGARQFWPAVLHRNFHRQLCLHPTPLCRVYDGGIEALRNCEKKRRAAGIGCQLGNRRGTLDNSWATRAVAQ